MEVANVEKETAEEKKTPKATKRGNPAQIVHEEPLMLNHTVGVYIIYMLNHTETERTLCYMCKYYFQTFDIGRNFLNNLKRLVWVLH